MAWKKRPATNRLKTARPCGWQRRKRSLPKWRPLQLPKISDKSTLAEAIRYTRGRMPKARAYLENGALELDNNICERSIKPVTLSRKNYRFMASKGGGETAAIA